MTEQPEEENTVIEMHCEMTGDHSWEHLYSVYQCAECGVHYEEN